MDVENALIVVDPVTGGLLGHVGDLVMDGMPAPGPRRTFRNPTLCPVGSRFRNCLDFVVASNDQNGKACNVTKLGRKQRMLQTMKQTIVLSLLIVIALGSANCASMGRRIDSESASQIRVGRTNKQQVLNLLGSPDGSSTNGRGDTTWTYNYTGAQMKPESFIPYFGGLVGGSNIQHQSTTVVFGPGGVVKDFTNSENSTETGVNLGSSRRPTLKNLDENKRRL